MIEYSMFNNLPSCDTVECYCQYCDIIQSVDQSISDIVNVTCMVFDHKSTDLPTRMRRGTQTFDSNSRSN